jgi:glucan biosynthesis protein C
MAGTHNLRRLHALDALRASMMLLGLVLHSAVSYTTYPLGAAWPYQDAQQTGLSDWLVFIIHLFRMPAFFVMAGFFAAFLYYREGAAGFLAHRARRLLLPLVVAWIVVFPLVRSGFAYALSGGGRAGLDPALQVLTTAPYADPTLAHLWFIYYLIIFCALATAVVPIVERAAGGARAGFLDAFARVAPTAGGCLVLGVLSAMTLLPMTKAALDTSFDIVPAPRVLVAYAVFFVFGWLLFARRDLVPAFGRRPWLYLPAAFAVSVVYMVIVVSGGATPSFGYHLAGVCAAGIAMWLWIYGVIGFFVRYCEHPRPLQRYLSDASYWMYLIHLPFTIWIPGALAPLAIPGVLKFVIVLTATSLVTVGTYHLFVRSTAIGAFLNGRKFERALPRVQATTVPAPTD